MNTRMKRYVFLLLAVVMLLIVLDIGNTIESKTLSLNEKAELEQFSVVRVIDGDTIVVKDKEDKEFTVRFVGVDTPETVHPKKPPEFYGIEASTFTRNLLRGEKVYLIGPTYQDREDKYKRRLAYVYRAPDGLFVNAEIIRQGYGRFYIPKGKLCKHQIYFENLQDFAKRAGKGLWSATRPEEPIPKETESNRQEQQK